jgi:hypothetical protein
MPRIYIDDYSARHVVERIKERIPDPIHQKIMSDTIRKLLTMEAPRDAVGHYQWHINVNGIGRIVLRGHSIRTVYSFNERYPSSTRYKIIGNQLIRA